MNTKANTLSGGWFDLTQCAREYPISRRKLQQLVYQQRLKAYRLDRKIFVKREDLERLLMASPVGGDLDRIVAETANELLGK
ncbi:MAG: helix-turn-helix domain-containing protein [Deltaproteobacteria bacterium]|nr:helix-turn-helix domain-containing protein [Deltaproteobacteria bacterium]